MTLKTAFLGPLLGSALKGLASAGAGVFRSAAPKVLGLGAKGLGLAAKGTKAMTIPVSMTAATSWLGHEGGRASAVSEMKPQYERLLGENASLRNKLDSFSNWPDIRGAMENWSPYESMQRMGYTGAPATGGYSVPNTYSHPSFSNPWAMPEIPPELVPVFASLYNSR